MRIKRALEAAFPIAAVTLLLSLGVALARWRQFVAEPVGVLAAVLGLSLVVLVTYATFALAGYRVRQDGTASVPRLLGWGVAALAALLLVLAIVALAFMAQQPR